MTWDEFFAMPRLWQVAVGIVVVLIGAVAWIGIESVIEIRRQQKTDGERLEQ